MTAIEALRSSTKLLMFDQYGTVVDMQGGLISASGSSGQPGDSEINAIRNRAQLLRSHALTRRSVQGHDK